MRVFLLTRLIATMTEVLDNGEAELFTADEVRAAARAQRLVPLLAERFGGEYKGLLPDAPGVQGVEAAVCAASHADNVARRGECLVMKLALHALREEIRIRRERATPPSSTC